MLNTVPVLDGLRASGGGELYSPRLDRSCAVCINNYEESGNVLSYKCGISHDDTYLMAFFTGFRAAVFLVAMERYRYSSYIEYLRYHFIAYF